MSDTLVAIHWLIWRYGGVVFCSNSWSLPKLTKQREHIHNRRCTRMIRNRFQYRESRCRNYAVPQRAWPISHSAVLHAVSGSQLNGISFAQSLVNIPGVRSTLQKVPPLPRTPRNPYPPSISPVSSLALINSTMFSISSLTVTSWVSSPLKGGCNS